MMQRNKKGAIINIAVFVVVVGLIVTLVGMRYYEEHQNNVEKETSKKSSQSKYVPPKPTGKTTTNPKPKPAPKPAPAPAPKPKPKIQTATAEDYNRLETILPQNEVIQALPEDARILLSFFNFNTGKRQWERDYLIGKGSAKQVSSMPSDLDMKMIMHSRNVPKLQPGNLCNVVQIAKKNGDYATEIVRSKTSLLWKYKGVMKYKDCLGL